jgi:separase
VTLLVWKKSKILKDYEQVLGVNFLDNVVNQIEILSKFSDPEMTHISSPSFDTSQALKRIHCSLVKNHDSSFSKSICDAVLNLVKKVLIGNDAYLYQKCVFSLLNLVAEESFASSECRAEALYLLATECLEQGRQSGELITLWSQNSKRGQHVVESDDHIPHLMRAKQYLLQAVSFIGPASSLLSRSVLRTLALVLGPEELNAECGISTGELVHSSIGSSARQAVARGLDADNPLDNRFRPVFEALDHPFSKQNERNEMIEIMHELGHQCIPHRWKFVAITLCPTGEVLVSIAQPSHDVNDNRFFSYQTQCVLPHKFNEFEETVLQPFDDIMDQSRNQISGIDSDVANDKYNNCKEKKQAWWNQRYNLDEKLCQLLKHFDERYFQSSGLEDFLSVDGLDEDDTCIGNLSARFDAVCNIDKKESGTREDTVPSKEELNKLTVVKLKERLADLGCSPNDFRSLRKAALIDFLHRESLEGCRSKPISQEKISPNENCIFLILDEQIQRLPLEAVETLHDRTVCRLPSLPFAISSILRKQSNEDSLLSPIDLSKTKYVIDPESNLRETQERILSTLTSVSENNNWDWEGRVGEAPAKDFMHRALQEKCGIFLYFGHGGGERFFSRTDIEELTSDSTCVDPFSSVILMGCSSGMLMSPNCQKGNSGDKMHFEPDGIALSYLCAGAPCVVGNLWDVTDRDIDRYSVSLLKGIYQARGPTNLAKCAMSSRGACKLKYIVGSAPVIYGIPVLIGPLK